MSNIVDFLTSIPGTVWSGFIGALIALSGVLISNRNNTERLRIQLEHDAAEKQRERITALRRDVYLCAMES